MWNLIRFLRKIETSISYKVKLCNLPALNTITTTNTQPTSSNQYFLHTAAFDREKIMMTNSTTDNNLPQCFKGSTDRFGGVTVTSKNEPCDQSSFESNLIASLAEWKSSGVRGVWFHIHLEDTHWVPVLAKNGFEFHHAESSKVVMVRWMPTNEPHSIPRYAHTVVGVGALVIKEDTSEVLVVRERFHIKPHWKLPGGYVERGEDLSVAAAREVMEETGIVCEFVSLVSTRHTHQAAFMCSDFYFIVLMRPISTDITMCTQELVACQWMKLSEYRNHPLVHETNRFFVDCYLQSKENGVSIGATPLYSSVMKKQQTIYSIDYKQDASLHHKQLKKHRLEKDENNTDRK